MITREEANNELQRRCNGLKNPNHVLEVALQMQKEIFDSLESQLLSNPLQLTCDGCSMYGANFGNGYYRNYCTKMNMFTNDKFGCIFYKKDTK